MIRCFPFAEFPNERFLFIYSMFAGTAIICNFLLMVTWTPAALSFYQRFFANLCTLRWNSKQVLKTEYDKAKELSNTCCCISQTFADDNTIYQYNQENGQDQVKIVVLGPPRPQSNSSNGTDFIKEKLVSIKTSIKAMIDSIKYLLENVISIIIIRPRFFWLSGSGILTFASAVVIFYSPGLKVPENENFPLFKEEHVFEVYDSRYKRHFGFERILEKDLSFKMPLRFVWGVMPQDDGSKFDPASRGKTVPDTQFDMSSPDSQRWMLRFCRQLTKQPFFRTSTIGPLPLSNCFIQTFKEWMERRCFDELGGEDYTPCCEVSQFPFSRDVFNKCLVLAIGDLYETPLDFWRPSVAGPKFNLTTDTVEAIIIEFESNVTFSLSHQAMDRFFKDVEMWFKAEIGAAPRTLKNGFFLSHLKFYDVQDSLLADTFAAIAIALVGSIFFLAIFSRDVKITLSASVTICSVILVTVAALIIGFDWKLSILESVSVTLAIGLSVDFSLHYAVAYELGSRSTVNGIKAMTGPVTMAAITTAMAGVCLIPTRVLAYVQIGRFIVILMVTSWFFSTFFLHAILHIIEPFNFFRKSSSTSTSEDSSFYDHHQEVIAKNTDEFNRRPFVVSEATAINGKAFHHENGFDPVNGAEAGQKTSTFPKRTMKQKSSPSGFEMFYEAAIVHGDTMDFRNKMKSCDVLNVNRNTMGKSSKRINKSCNKKILGRRQTSPKLIHVNAEEVERPRPKSSASVVATKGSGAISDSLQFPDFFSPLHHEEIVTVVDDCHPDLILRSQPEKSKKEVSRRSLSSSGINSIKSGGEANLNSFETMFAVSDGNVKIAGTENPFPTNETIDTATLPFSQLLRCLHRHQHSVTRGSEKVAVCNQLQQRHPLSHSQETILFTDDGYDPHPILPNRTPGTPDVWVPITRTIRA